MPSDALPMIRYEAAAMREPSAADMPLRRRPRAAAAAERDDERRAISLEPRDDAPFTPPSERADARSERRADAPTYATCHL